MIINRTCMLLIAASLLLPGCSHTNQSITEPVQSTEILRTGTTWAGQPLYYPDGDVEITGIVVEIAPGESTGWHQHPFPSYGYMIEGTLEVHLDDGRTLHLDAGDPIAEVYNTRHNGVNIGDTPVRIVVFYTGLKGETLTIRPPETAEEMNSP